eukprot:120233-Amphidinium_carterae.1
MGTDACMFCTEHIPKIALCFDLYQTQAAGFLGARIARSNLQLPSARPCRCSHFFSPQRHRMLCFGSLGSHKIDDGFMQLKTTGVRIAGKAVRVGQ